MVVICLIKFYLFIYYFNLIVGFREFKQKYEKALIELQNSLFNYF